MASTIPIRFSPQALSRPNNTRNPRSKPLPPKKLPSKPNPNRNHRNNRRRNLPPTSLSTVYGGEATTYTRLPPKHDFALPSLDSSSFSSSVVKLSESEVAAPNDVDREKDQSSSTLGFEYGKFELFEVNSDNEDEDYDEDENEDYIDYGGEMYESSSNLRSANGKFKQFEMNSDSEQEEEDYGLKFTGFERGEDGIEGEEEVREKEKGVPAVMRCFDRAKIFVKAGDGGNGVVAFRREKYVPFGGPSGGDGGRGGNVYIEVDGSMNSLLPFRQTVHFWGGRGAHGQGRNMNGAKGEDVVVKVAPGTVIREAVEGDEGARGEGVVLLELMYPGQRALLLPGGRGGRGNASFKTGNNKVPRIAENGEEGPEMWLELELKLVADVGIIGAPNAGKSTLLSVVSAAQPAIANYPFTTLLPNLGVVSFDFDTTMVVADLPGLLEGAHRGFGLGHEFLRHTERCSALVHVVDGSSEQPEYEFDAVRLELELFNPDLAEKPYLVAYNKMDLPEASERWKTFKEKLQAHGIEPFCMSAVKSEGTHEVICAAYELVRKRIEDNKEGGWTDPVNLNYVADMVKKQRTAPIEEFEISHDSSTNTWHVNGAGLQRFVHMTNWRYVDSERRFQHVLEACGVYKSLTNLGVKEGDTVVVGEMELVWHDSADSSPSNLRKGSTNSIRWPQFT